MDYVKCMQSVAHKSGEYFLKNAVLNKLSNDAKAASEFMVKRDRVDFIFTKSDSSSTIFEIKSDIDNLNGIKEQLDSYYRIANVVYLVIHINIYNEDIYNKIRPETGIILYDNKYNEFITMKDADYFNDLLNKETMLSSMNKKMVMDMLLFENRVTYDYFKKMGIVEFTDYVNTFVANIDTGQMLKMFNKVVYTHKAYKYESFFNGDESETLFNLHKLQKLK